MHHVGDQAHRLVEFLQPLRVHGIALHQVLAQHVGGPDAELGAAQGIDPVAHRNNHVQIVEIHLADFSIGGNLCIFCTG